MRLLVVGSGSIGRRHFENLSRVCPDAELVMLTRPTTPRGDFFRVDQHATDLGDVLSAPVDGAIVATPAPFHAETAVPLLEAGVATLVEKPLAATSRAGQAILDAARDHDTPAMVGYTLRSFAPLEQLIAETAAGAVGRPLHVTASVGSHLAGWRPHQDYRSSVTARADLGGGALLELSHELDYCLWLLGRPIEVSAALTRTGSLDIDVEDVADVTIGFATGARANVHLDLVDRRPHRRCRVIGDEATFTLDLLRGELVLERPDGSHETRCAAAVDRNAMYLRQSERFLALIGRETTPDPGLHDGMAVLELIDAIREADHNRTAVARAAVTAPSRESR